MKRKRIRIVLFTLLALSSIFFVSQSDILSGLSTQRAPRGVLWIIEEVVRHIKEDYLVKPDPSQTMEGAFQGLVNSLDEFSSYLTKEAVAKYHQREDADLFDIGIVLYKKFQTFPVVVGVRDNSPASAKGIQIGDTISALDGKSTLLMSMSEANLYLADKSKDPVRIRILRFNENEEVSVERRRLFDRPYSYRDLEGTSGILTVFRLDSSFVRELNSSLLPRLLTQRLPLVIDLRNCSQGDFEAMQKFVNLFLQSSNIGHFEKKGGKKDVLSCPSSPDLAQLPLLIWANQATMGPAEAAAAVLQKNKRAKIVGFPTPGLVASQKFVPLEDGSGLLLTTAIFYLSDKNKLWGQGVEPDEKMEGFDQNFDAYLKKTQSILLDN
jgi:carboxyl-terminal processing protease